jgi:hypothetical protein
MVCGEERSQSIVALVAENDGVVLVKSLLLVKDAEGRIDI